MPLDDGRVLTIGQVTLVPPPVERSVDAEGNTPRAEQRDDVSPRPTK